MTTETLDFTGLLDSLTLPSVEAEEWRYSRVGSIDLAAYRPTTGDAGPVPAAAAALAHTVVDAAALVVLHNGRIVALDVSNAATDQGLVVERTPAGQDSDLSLAEDAFTTLTCQLSEIVRIAVRRGATVSRPVVIVHWTDAAGVLATSRVVVDAGEDSDIGVVELYGGDATDALTVPLTELLLQGAARVRHSSIQRLGSGITQVGYQAARIGQSATLAVGHVALGGDYARMRFDAELAGRGAFGSIATVYAGNGDQMHDLRTFQRHIAQDTTSDLSFKGAVDDRAHAVYTGMIHITKDGRGTNATQSNRIVKLGPDAWAESVPNLEIENNDVKCAHASTVGPIDPDQRFYLESRGVRPDSAARLVVNGFFSDVIEALPLPELVDDVRRSVAEKIGGAS